MKITRPEKQIPLRIRSDKAGDGNFNASRGRNRTHNGVDILVEPGDRIHSPVQGIFTKHGYCYADDMSWRYIEIESDYTDQAHRIFYILVEPSLKVGDHLMRGDFIGVAADITDRYPSIGMLPHIHYEIKNAEGAYLDPDIGEKEWNRG